MRSWIYLFLASCFEIAWIYSLKAANFKDLFVKHNFKLLLDWKNDVAIAGYIVFGIGNIFFFSLAMKQLPSSTAYAVWVGITLIGLTLIDGFYLKQHITIVHILCILFIFAGIIGLKIFSVSK
jgi:quaternary ammonium compound-resistance protein SugE